jgi:osmotically-inducible protein OsmY
MFKTFLAAVMACALAGCNSLIASATGPDPVGHSQGTRTLSMRLEDSSIERTASINMYKANDAFRQANVNVISFYGSVLLAGQVPSEELKAEAERIVRELAEVKQVHNELTVGPASYYQERGSDGAISMRIRALLTFDKEYPSARTKIFTVGGVVYLMGKLTNAEADKAINYIREVAGVKKIVKLVDYLPTPNKVGA